jgi:hypothetical protein
MYGMLSGVELDGHDEILICFGVVMNAGLGGGAKPYLLRMDAPNWPPALNAASSASRTLQTATSWKSGRSEWHVSRDSIKRGFWAISKNMVDGGAHVNLRLVRCDASSNALFD